MDSVIQMPLFSVLMGVSIFIFSISAFYVMFWRRTIHLDAVLEFWGQIIQFWISYITLRFGFSQCHQGLQRQVLVAQYLLLEFTGRGLIVLVDISATDFFDQNYKPSRKISSVMVLSIKLILILHVTLVANFLLTAGSSTCTCMLLSTSFTAVVDGIYCLLKHNMTQHVESITNIILRRKLGRLCRTSKRLLNNACVPLYYSSETLDDLNTELVQLIQSNGQNFVNIFRLTFAVGSIALGLVQYGIQIQSLIFSLKLFVEVLFFTIKFLTGFSSTLDSWTSYGSLTDDEMRPLIVRYYSKIKDSGSSPVVVSHNKKNRSTISGGTKSAGDIKIHVLEKKSSKNEEDLDSCAICLTALNIETVKIKQCGHKFHEGCLLCLLRLAENDMAKKCPICRKRIVPGNDDDDYMAFLVPHM